jgi:O-methyltransferase
MTIQSGTKARRRRFDTPFFDMLRRLGLLDPLLRTYRRFSDHRRRAKALEGKGLVPEKELTHCYRQGIEKLRSLNPDQPIGDYLEFGVCYGSSMACMHDALVAMDEKNTQLYGFDSFEGMPKAAGQEDNGNWTPGQLRSPLHFTRELLTRRGIDWTRTHLVKGWFDETLIPDTAKRFGIERVGIVMIDCVIYSSTRAALAFCAPLIKDHAIIIFDDWNAYDLADQNMGERRAFEEFMAGHPEFAGTELPSYHRLATVFLISRRNPAG